MKTNICRRSSSSSQFPVVRFFFLYSFGLASMLPLLVVVVHDAIEKTLEKKELHEDRMLVFDYVRSQETELRRKTPEIKTCMEQQQEKMDGRRETKKVSALIRNMNSEEVALDSTHPCKIIT